MTNHRTTAIIELLTEIRDLDAARCTDSTYDDYINDLADLLDPTRSPIPFDDDAHDDALDASLDAARLIMLAMRPDIFDY